MATRDYRSTASRQKLLEQGIDPVTGLPGRQTLATDPYSMPAPTFGGGLESTDPLAAYERRNEGAGGVGSGAMKGASMGAAAGSVLPGLGTAVGAGFGALGGAIAGAFTKNAKTAMTDFSEADARDAIGKAYQRHLGRAGGQDEIATHLRNQGLDGGNWVGEDGLRSVLAAIESSEEAKRYAANPNWAAQQGAPPSALAGASPMNAPTGNAPSGQFTGGSGALVDPYTLPSEPDLQTLLANAQRYTDYDASTGRTGFAGAGGGDGYSYLGFDFAQDPGNRDVGKSAKYAFSEFARQAAAEGAPQPRTKAEAEAWFTQYIAPKMQAAGYEIGWVKGDKARVKTREGWDEIDFVGNADGDNPQLTWQSELLAPGGGMSSGALGGGVGTVPNGGMDLTSSTLFEQLMQQVREIAAGKSNGALATDTNALLSMLAR